VGWAAWIIEEAAVPGGIANSERGWKAPASLSCRINRVALKSGRYEFRFFADEVWRDDPAAELKTLRAMGTTNSVRIV